MIGAMAPSDAAEFTEADFNGETRHESPPVGCVHRGLQRHIGAILTDIADKS